MNKPKDFLQRSRKAFCVSALIFLTLISVFFSTRADDVESQAIITIELANVTPGVTMVGANDNDHLGGNGAPDSFSTLPRSQPIVSGDFNKDGILDLAVGAPDVDYTAPNTQINRANTGAVYILFGRNPFITPALIDTNIASQNQPDIKIFGATNNDQVGFSLAVGDINADGNDDLLVGAPGFDPGTTPRVDAGAVFIMLGAQGLTPKTIDLAAANAINIAIFGEKAGDKFGASVAAGDVGGVSTSVDILAGAPGSKGPADDRVDGGAAYWLYGGTSFTPVPPTTTRVLDLSTSPANGRIFGVAGSALGSTVAIGNINATAPADIIVGAVHANRPAPDAANDTGAVFVAFGGDNLLPTPPATAKTFDVAVALQNPNLSIYGNSAGDHLGASVATGDVTGDGTVDLVLGAPDADGPADGRADAGEAYLITGSTTLTTTPRIDVSLATVNLTIFGALTNNHLGSAVAVGRLNVTGNTDGISELIVGTPGAASNRGAVSAFYGGASLTVLATRDLLLGQDDLRVNGQAAGDELGWSLATTDIDNNRGGDLVLGAPFADVPPPTGLTRTNVGKVYVLFAQSDNVPPVNEPPVVQVSAPNGGEALQGGASTNITWTASDPNGNGTIASFEIRLSIDGGTSYNTIVATNVPGDARTFNWIVTPGLNTSMARIRVIALDTTGLTGQDDSNANFTITDPGITVTLTAPNGGEQLITGQMVQITWTVPQVSEPLVRGFDLFLSTDGGTNFNIGIASNPLEPALGAAVRSFTWTVNDLCTSTARILVVATSTTGARSSDTSNANFSISRMGPTINTNSMPFDTTLERLVLKATQPPIGNEILFAENATIEISNDEAGTTFFGFSKAPKLKQSGRKIVTKGTINGQPLLTFFPNNAVRVVRVINPPCGITLLRVRRVGDMLVLENPAPGAASDVPTN